MRQLLKKYRYPLLIITIAAIVYYRWLSLAVFSSGDYKFHFAEDLRETQAFGMWDYFGLGTVNILPWRLMGPGSLLYGLFGMLGLNSNIADKFMVIWPWVFFSGISSFFLVRKITKSNAGGFIGSLVFSYNTYFLAINTQGHLLLSMASVYAVLAFLFLLKSIEEGKKSAVVLTALFLFLTGASDFRVYYLSILLVFIYFLYHSAFVEGLSGFRKFLKNSLVFAVPVGISLLLNLFWIAASLKAGSLTENAVLDRNLFGDGFFKIENAITLTHPFWASGRVDWFIVQGISIHFWLIPIMALLGLILNRKNKNVLFFGIISVLGIFLSKQTNEPFGYGYRWLFENLPGFNAFREASKFYFFVALGYAVLIGAFTAWLWSNWSRKKIQIYGRYSLIFLITLVFIWNTKSIISGGISPIFVAQKIPRDYLIFKDFVLNQQDSFRTFWVPTYSKYAIFTSGKPLLVGGMLEDGFLKPSENLSEKEKAVAIFALDDAGRVFDNFSIKYVVIPNQDFSNEQDPFLNYGEAGDADIRKWYISEIDQVNWLKKIDSGTKDLVVYENENYRPHIYLTEETETINEAVEFKKTDFVAENPEKYDVSIENVREPVYLNFSEKFNPKWKLHVGGFSWPAVLMNKDYAIVDDNHFRNDAGLNSFYIDPDEICSSESESRRWCKLNEDGSYDINLTLYFEPQGWFYLGLVISVLTLVGCLGYLGYYRSMSSSRKINDKTIF